MSTSRYAFMAAALFALSTAAAGADTVKPLRHLEYHFTVGVRGETTLRTSGIGGGVDAKGDPSAGGDSVSGVSTKRTGLADSGTITADFMGMSGDGGAVYLISEKARESRNAEPAQCLVYANTNLICDNTKTIYDEEIALLRTLGKDFTHAVPMDPKKHWQYRESTPGSLATTDYMIKDDTNNIVTVSIDSLLKVSGVNSYTATTSGTIHYKRIGSVPLSISTLTISHTSDGQNRGETNIDLNLVNDSLASAGSAP